MWRMGVGSSTPYVIDDFDSADDVEELESWRRFNCLGNEKKKHIHSSNLSNMYDKKVGTTKSLILPSAPHITRKGSRNLFKLPDRNECREDVTPIRARSITIATINEFFSSESEKQDISATFSSSWSSKSQERMKSKSATYPSSAAVEDKNLNVRKPRSMSDQARDSQKYQKIEKKATNASRFRSGIPRPIWRSLDGSKSQNNIGRSVNKGKTSVPLSRCRSNYFKETKSIPWTQSESPPAGYSLKVERSPYDDRMSLNKIRKDIPRKNKKERGKQEGKDVKVNPMIYSPGVKSHNEPCQCCSLLDREISPITDQHKLQTGLNNIYLSPDNYQNEISELSSGESGNLDLFLSSDSDDESDF